ncbi:MAG TPA: YhbY family RNA-binding protein [Candidatus Krumholzibacteria bacterium]|jgi:RNA-binding protein
MPELAGYQRKYLRSIAHGMDPQVHVGQSGLSPNLLSTVEEALLKHELIKVRFVAFKEHRKAIAAELAQEAGAELVGLLGATALYFRAHPEAGKRKLEIPQR